MKRLEVLTRGATKEAIHRIATHPGVHDAWEDDERVLVTYDASSDELIHQVTAAGATIVDARPLRSPLREAYEAIVAADDARATPTLTSRGMQV